MQYIKVHKKKHGFYTWAGVDDEDYAPLLGYKWTLHKNKDLFYAVHPMRSKSLVLMHQLICGPQPDGFEIDHIDGNGLNNTKANLRFVTHRQNMQNIHGSKTSVFPGVHQNKAGSWVAQIVLNGKKVYLGSFATEVEAFVRYAEVCHQYGFVISTPEGGETD